MLRNTMIAVGLFVIGLTLLFANGLTPASAAAAAAPAAAACPAEPGPPVALGAGPVESPPAVLPAPAPGLALPKDADTVTTPGADPSGSPIATPVPGVAAGPAPEELKAPLTLGKALEIAFLYSPDIQGALAGVEKGRGQLREARARFNPSFNVEASTMLQGPATTLQLGEQTVELVPDTITNASLSFLLPLDISHRLGHARDLARYGLQMEYLTMVGVSENVILNVKSAYYNLLRACGQQEVAQSAVDVSAKRLENTRSRQKAGTVAQFDVTAAETELANLRQQLISAQSRVYIAQSQLNAVMGVDVNCPTQVVLETPPVDIKTVDVPGAVERAYARRPEIKATQLAVTAGRTTTKLERAALRPSLGVTGTANFNPEPTGFAGEKLTWHAGLALSMPIWDGGVTKARVEQAQAGSAAARETLQRTRLNIAHEVRAAALNLQDAALRTATTAQAVTLAEEALRLANVRYQAGIAVSVEVTNAEAQLTQAKFNQVNAGYDYAIALAQLQRAQSDQPELASLQLLADRVSE